ncbi:MAG: response regulator transcription factor [Mycoplasmatales bacterium]
MRVLLVEDELFLARSIAKKFQNKNIDVTQEPDGNEALDLILYDNFDIIILDIMLPGLDGLSIIKEVRAQKNDIPIILTSAKSQIDDKIKGLEAGADDYLAKPYDFEELLARIYTNLRRINNNFDFEENNNTIGNLTYERNSLLIQTADNKLNLTLKEFDLLEYLIKNSPNVLSKDQIIDKIWGFNSDIMPNQVEVYISYLRKKLLLIKANIKISTIRGLGYKVELNDV